jgi:1-acyl-sn-glycerol-3-phosphate acyltransferase
MRLIIAFTKLILVILATAFFYLLIILGIPLSFFGLGGAKWRAYFLSKWGATICKIIGLKIQVQGKPPNPPFFMVSNHLSYIDIFALISKTRCVFIAKSEVLSWPMFGFMSKTVGMLFVDRNKRTDVKRVNKLISETINSAQGILLFPEGTTTAGIDIAPYKASLLAYPAELIMPVHYATLTYYTSENESHASESVCWWREVTFLSHFMQLLKLRKIYGTITFGDEPITNNDRKELANELHQKSKRQFIPVKEYVEHGKRSSSS